MFVHAVDILSKDLLYHQPLMAFPLQLAMEYTYSHTNIEIETQWVWILWESWGITCSKKWKMTLYHTSYTSSNKGCILKWTHLWFGQWHNSTHNTVWKTRTLGRHTPMTSCEHFLQTTRHTPSDTLRVIKWCWHEPTHTVWIMLDKPEYIPHWMSFVRRAPFGWALLHTAASSWDTTECHWALNLQTKKTSFRLTWVMVNEQSW